MNNHLIRYTDIERPERIPEGKVFKFLFDANLEMMRVVCSEKKLFECMREAFSDTNDAAFYVQMHGFNVDSKVYLINPFGYFKPGLLFNVLEYIETHFGSLSLVSMSQACKDYVSDYLTPLRKYVKSVDMESFTVRNISDDTVNPGLAEDGRLRLRDY